VSRGTGGAGRFRGGDGIDRDIELLCPAQITILSDRRTHGPYGLEGGEAGKPGRNVLTEPDGSERELPGKASLWVEAGAVIGIRTPGGGGYGSSVESA
jgi:N-methylhydantoinase B